MQSLRRTNERTEARHRRPEEGTDSADLHKVRAYPLPVGESPAAAPWQVKCKEKAPTIFCRFMVRDSLELNKGRPDVENVNGPSAFPHSFCEDVWESTG